MPDDQSITLTAEARWIHIEQQARLLLAACDDWAAVDEQGEHMSVQQLRAMRGLRKALTGELC